MKNRFFSLFMIAALLLPVLAGCGQAEPQGDAEARGSSTALPRHQVSAAQQTKTPVSSQETTETPDTLTREEAEAIALKHAGFAETEVTHPHTEYDMDDGVPHYDVEFSKDGWEYDFEIHAQTGAILNYHKEYEARSQNPPAAAETPAAPAVGTTILTREEAEAIALAHVGLTREEVTRLRVEYDIDDGVPQYEVEFYKDGWEYDFEIHAETGAILSYEKDD